MTSILQGSSKTQRTLAALLVFSIFFLFFFPLTWNSWIPRARYTSLLMLLIAGSLWLAMRIRSGAAFRIPRVVLPFAGYLALQTGLLAITPNPQYGLQKVLNNSVIFIIFLLYLESLNFGWRAAVWENALISMAILVSLIGALAVTLWFRAWWQLSASSISIPPVGVRIPGTMLGHPNPVAGFINLVVPLAIIRLMRKGRLLGRIFWIGVLSLLLGVEYFTSSRGAWISLAAGLAVTISLVFAPGLLNRGKLVIDFSWRKFIELRTVLLATGAILISAAILALLIWNIRFAGHGSNSERIKIWQRAWEIFATSPWWGHGPDSYPFLKATQSSFVTDENGYYHAHNLWLQLGAETGIAGILLAGMFIWVALRAFLSIWRQTPTGSFERNRLAAYAGAGVAVAIQHQIDDLFLQLLYTLGVFLVLALALRNAPKRETVSLNNKYASLVILGLLGLASFGTSYLMRGADQYQLGLSEARKGNWATARDQLCGAAEINRTNTLFAFQCGLANGFVAYDDGDSDSLAAAIAYTRQGLADDPNWYVHWANLATFEWWAGNHSQALALMRMAASSTTPKTTIALTLGWMEEESGHSQEALDAYRAALGLDPWLGEDRYFEKSAVRQRALQDLLADSASWQGRQAVSSGDFKTAEKALLRAIQSNPSDSTAYAALALAQQQLGEPGDAWLNVQKALFIGSSFRTLVLSSQVASMQSKSREAMSYLERAFDLVDHTTISQVYYDAAYHREVLPTDLSPYLIRLGGLAPEETRAFGQLAVYLSEDGKENKAQRVMDWIESVDLR
jgi:O-antigen ligase